MYSALNLSCDDILDSETMFETDPTTEENSSDVGDLQEETNTLNEFNLDILDPENPLMLRFQIALKNVLKAKLEKISQQVLQMENEIRGTKSAIETVACNIYEQKCELEKQTVSQNQYRDSISAVIAMKQKIENSVAADKKLCKSEEQKLKNMETENLECRRLLESKNNMLKQLRYSENLQYSNLVICKQVIEKHKNDKIIKLREKEKQDYILLKLELEVISAENLIDEYKSELHVACDELKLLQEHIIQQNVEFNINIEENQRLLETWKNVVNLIQKSDCSYSKQKDELQNIETLYCQKQTELKNYKKSLEEEILKNETLSIQKNKKQEQLNKNKRIHIQLMEKKNQLEEELESISNMIECTSINLKQTLLDQQDLKRDFTLSEILIKKLKDKKFKLEEGVLSYLQDEIMSNKAANAIGQQIRKLRKESLELETIIANMEDDSVAASVLLETEYRLLCNCKESVEDKICEIKTEERRSVSQEEQLKKIMLQVKFRNNDICNANKTLQSLHENPLLNADIYDRIKVVKEDLKTLAVRIQECKSQWVRKQNHIASLISKKSELVKSINAIKKQIFVFQHKNLQIEIEIDKANKELTNYTKSISSMLLNISKLNNLFDTKKQYGCALDSENFIMQNDIMEKLKENEKEIVSLNRELDEIKNTRESLGDEVLKLQHEDLQWEKKVKLVNEMRDNIQMEQSKSGEIGGLKTEIHRMEIRYEQLKKAQESLVSDLEMSVQRRDNVIDFVVSRKNNDKNTQTNQILNRKLRNIKPVIEQMLKKVGELDGKCRSSEIMRCELLGEIRNVEMRINETSNLLEESEEKVQCLYLLKQKNLDILIRKQRLADQLNRYKENQKIFNRNESSVEKEFTKNSCLNADLIKIVECLRDDFVQLKYALKRILNVLSSYPVDNINSYFSTL